jgi:tetratricopeptide (TPR) repeat protein
LIRAVQHQVRSLSQRDWIITFHKENGKSGYLVPLELQAKFVWMRLIKETLLRVPQTMDTIKKMHNRFFMMYRDNSRSLQEINDFVTNYQPKDAILWYTKDSFLYRHINSAMRTESISELHVCLPYIADLCRELEANRKYIVEELTFYRGCVLNNEEINIYHNNVGFLMGINTFFSASRNREIAEIFAGCGTLQHTTSVNSVIFEIHIDQNSSTVYTDISAFSNMLDEDEVLFDWNSVFRIRSVSYKDSEKCWIVDLITDYEVQFEIEKLYQQLDRKDKSVPPSILVLSNLISMGEYMQAFDYSMLLLEENPSDPHLLMCHEMACSLECDYNTAIKYLKKAQTITSNGTSLMSRGEAIMIMSTMTTILSSLGERTLSNKYKFNFMYPPKELNLFSIFGSRKTRKYATLLGDNNQLSTSKLYVELFSDQQGPTRYQILPKILIEYAHRLLLDGNYDESLTQLKRAEFEAVKLITAYSPLRFNLQMLFASVYIHQYQLRKASEHLGIAYHILMNSYSRSSPTALASYHIVWALICIIDNQSDKAFNRYLPRARVAYLKSGGFIDLNNVTLALWSICHMHERHINNSMNISIRIQLEKLMDECFNLCEFDKILYGKSEDNDYRHLFDYAQQTKLNASKFIDHEHNLSCKTCHTETSEFETNEDSKIIFRL